MCIMAAIIIFVLRDSIYVSGLLANYRTAMSWGLY